jgi:hypothetical protein
MSKGSRLMFNHALSLRLIQYDGEPSESSMTQTINYQTPQGPFDFRDRKTGLLVMGIILIAMGAIAACLSVLAPIGLIVGRRANPSAQLEVRAAVVGLLVYALLSIALIWGGIGSIKCRRWIRPLVLVLGTLCLLVGVLTLGVMIVSIPTMFTAMQRAAAPGTPAMPPAARGVFVAVILLFILILYIGIPAVYVWFYRQTDVRQTLEYYDPRARWTDDRPLPLLGMSVAAALAALSCLLGLFTYKAIPLFGFIVTGAPGVAVVLAGLIVFAAAAVLIYRGQMAGWWLVVIFCGVFALSSIVSAARLDDDQLVDAMQMPPQEAEIFRSSPMSKPMVFGFASAVTAVAVIGYALWARRFFQPQFTDSVTANTQ